MFYFLLAFYLLTSVSCYFLFPKAGRKAWEGLVPFYNVLVGCDIVGRKRIHAALMLIPLVNVFIFAALATSVVKSFGKLGFWHSVMAIVATPIYFFYLANQKDVKYVGPSETMEREYKEKILAAQSDGKIATLKKLQAKNPYKKSPGREWAESILFAVFAAAFIRMFLIEAYIIPTASMEGSLMVGDFLFVSKPAYGLRMPQTIAMIPLLHNTIPILKKESYLKKPQLKYHRTKPIRNIKVNDPIVFNWPAGDSVYFANNRTYSLDQVRSMPGLQRMVKDKKMRVRPVDKKDHYIKRCLAGPGDKFEIKDRNVFIDGEEIPNPTNVQFSYQVATKSKIRNETFKKIGINSGDMRGQDTQNGIYFYRLLLSQSEVDALKEVHKDLTAEIFTSPTRMWPYDVESTTWTLDNYGPILIPAAGTTVELTPHNIALYGKAINDYEGNDAEFRAGKVFIDGKEIKEYTFKQNYYWAVGDNRHASEDSRYWGFVPEDHIVGRPLFIWMSLNEAKLSKGVNWRRIGRGANKF